MQQMMKAKLGTTNILEIVSFNWCQKELLAERNEKGKITGEFNFSLPLFFWNLSRKLFLFSFVFLSVSTSVHYQCCFHNVKWKKSKVHKVLLYGVGHLRQMQFVRCCPFFNSQLSEFSLDCIPSNLGANLNCPASNLASMKSSQ